jgi:hypothetical protein
MFSPEVDGSGADIQQVEAVEASDRLAVAQGKGTQAAQMDGSAGNLLNAAGGGGGGGFKLDPAAAAALAASCQAAIDKISDMGLDLGFIQQAPKLGTLGGAQAVASYTQNVATDPQGMLHAMQSLSATLTQMQQAYIKASTNYQETNDQVADILKKIDPDYKPTSSSSSSSNTTPADPSSVAANQNVSA